MKKFTDDHYLKIAFLIGGIYDIILGISMIFLSDFIVRLLNITKPEPMVLPYTIGVFLIIIGYFLIIATQDVRRLAFIGAGSCIIRFGYAFLAVLAYFTQDLEAGYLLMASTDTITAIILLVPLLLTEGVSWKNLWQL